MIKGILLFFIMCFTFSSLAQIKTSTFNKNEKVEANNRVTDASGVSYSQWGKMKNIHMQRNLGQIKGTKSLVQIYFNDFNTDDGTWDGSTGGTNSWTNVDPSVILTPFDGNCFITDGISAYANDATYYLTSPQIDLTGRTNCVVRFQMWINAELDYDGGDIECYDGTSWVKMNSTELNPGYNNGSWYSGDLGWIPVTLKLPSSFNNISNFQLRYLFTSDVSNTGYGWAIDDFEVIGDDGINNDQAALEAIYNNMGGTNWTNQTNWMTTAPISDWYGVTTNAEGYVVELELAENNVTGTIPTEIGNLTHLTYLSFWGNTVSGSIPPELWSLTNLYTLSLGNNQFSGDIGTFFAPHKNLGVLWMNHNQFTGDLSSILSYYPNIKTINFYNNLIGGTIPVEISNLYNLEYLYMRYNQLTGSIPPEIGNLGNMVEMSFADNQLTGTIPFEIGNIETLSYLNLGTNQLSGEIPTSITNLSNLQYLMLNDNQLTGSIPSEIGNLGDLLSLDLSFNQLSGQLPISIGSLTMLNFLSTRANMLSGSIPSGIWTLTSLEELDLAGDPNYTGAKLTGDIPSEISNLANLTLLSLASNQITSVPESLWDLTNLEFLFLHNNQIHSTIGVGLSLMSSLVRLQLNNNEFYGSMPASLSSLTNLSILNLENNMLEDLSVLPAQLAGQDLYVANNYFTFADLIPQASFFSDAPQYSPQKNFKFTNTRYGFCDGGDISLSANNEAVKVLGDANNQYQWFRDATNVTGISSSDLYQVFGATSADAGNYTCQVTNSVLPSLTLVSENLAVSIQSTPAVPGAITGNSSVCLNSSVEYRIDEVVDASSYVWSVPGGATFSGNSTSNVITVNYGPSAVMGNLSVYGVNACGAVGEANSMAITVLSSSAPTGNPVITGDDKVCLSASYTVTGVTGASSYSWTVPAGAVITSGGNTGLINVDFTNAVSGDIIVSGVNTCGNGLQTILPIEKDIEPETPSAITGPIEVCPGSTGNVYSINDISNADSYVWSVPSGATIISGNTTNSISIDYDNLASSGDIIVNGVNVCGNGPSVNLAVNINGAVANAGVISGSTEVCLNSQAGFSVSDINGATSYQWTVPTGASIISGGSTNNVTVEFSSAAQTGNITVQGVNACNTGNQSVLALTLPLQAGDAGTITGSDAVCQNTNSITYTVQDIVNAVSYSWSVPIGATIVNGNTTNTITVDFGSSASSGNVTVAGANTCDETGNSNSLAVTVNSVPSPPSVINGETVVCQGLSQTYSITPVINADSYIWSSPSGKTFASVSNDVVVEYDNTIPVGTFTLEVAAENNCGVSPKSTLDIEVSQISLPELVVKWNNLIICRNTDGEYVSFEWRRVGSNDPIGQNRPYVDVAEQGGSGTYYVIVENSAGCSRQSNNHAVKIAASTSIYPNPSSETGVLKIVNDYEGELNISIINSTSSIVREMEVAKNNEIFEVSLPVAELKSGIYQVVISTNEGLMSSEKLIIVK